jgi:hypothetical protein
LLPIVSVSNEAVVAAILDLFWAQRLFASQARARRLLFPFLSNDYSIPYPLLISLLTLAACILCLLAFSATPHSGNSISTNSLKLHAATLARFGFNCWKMP